MFTTPLIVAVRNTQEDCVSRLLAAGADPNKKIQDGKNCFATPLMEAVLHYSAEIVNDLLEAAAHINTEIKVKEGCVTTPLIEAVRNNHGKSVNHLLAAGADPNKTTEVKEGCVTTPLIEAVRSNHGKSVNYLLAAGADPNKEIEVKEGCVSTPLIEAVRSNHGQSVNHLLAAGADPNKETENHQGDVTKPLAVAALHKHEEIFYRLLDAGALCSKAYKGCRGAELLYDAVSGNDGEMAKYLLAMDIDANHGREGSTLLTLAISNGCVKVVEFLLDEGADANKAAEAPFDDGTTPLIQAILTGSDDLVKLLLDKGADPNKQGQCEEDLVSTPLIAAVRRNKGFIVEYLLQAGADPNFTDPVFFGKGITPLIQAVWAGSCDLVKLLLDMGADPNKPGQEKRTALREAMIRNNSAVVSILLDAGANPHTPVESSGKKTTVLIESTARNYNEIVNILLAKGTDPNQLTMDEETAMMLARTPEVLQTLLEHGALINHPGMMSDLFQCSLQDNHSSIPYILLQHGVNVGSNSQPTGSIIQRAKDRPDLVLLGYLMFEAGYSTRNDAFVQDVLIHGDNSFHQSLKRAKRSNEESPTGQMALAETSVHIYSYIDDIVGLLQKEYSLEERDNAGEDFGQRGFKNYTASLSQKTYFLDENDSADTVGLLEKVNYLEEDDNPDLDFGQQGFDQHTAGLLQKEIEKYLKRNSLDEDDNSQETVSHKGIDLLPEVLAIIDQVEAILKYPVVKSVIDPSLADRLKGILGQTDINIQLLELKGLKRDIRNIMHQVERLIAVCHWFDGQEQQVPTLSHLSRISVRAAVKKATGGRSIIVPISRLRLPKILEDQLLFKNLIPTYMSQLMTTPTRSRSVATLLQEARRVVRNTIQTSMTGDDIEQEVEKLSLRKELKDLITLPDRFFLPPCTFTAKPETESQQNDGEDFFAF